MEKAEKIAEELKATKELYLQFIVDGANKVLDSVQTIRNIRKELEEKLRLADGYADTKDYTKALELLESVISTRGKSYASQYWNAVEARKNFKLKNKDMTELSMLKS